MTKSILIVDDEDCIRDVCKTYLSENFENIFLAGNAESGLDKLKKHSIDVVLIDINMPKMNGFDFVEIAKKKHPNIKFLLISGDVSLLNLHRSIRCGVHDFIEKPFSQTTLLDRVMIACKEELHIYTNHSLKSVIGEINREKTLQQKNLLLDLREEVFTRVELSQGNMQVLRFDLEEMFDLKINAEKSGLMHCLTPVESKISELIDAGYSAMAISKKMNRSINTIQVHIRSIRKKFGLVKHSQNREFENCLS